MLFFSTLTGKWHHGKDHGKVSVTSKTLQSTSLIVTYLVCSWKHWLDVCPKSKTSPKTWWFINTYAVPNIWRQHFIDHSCLFCSSLHAFKKLEQFGGRHVAQAKNVLFSSFVGSGAILWWEQSSIVVSLQITFSNGLPRYRHSSALASKSECSTLWRVSTLPRHHRDYCAARINLPTIKSRAAHKAD